MKFLVCRSGYVVSNLEAYDLTAEKAKKKEILKWEKMKLFALEILQRIPRKKSYIKDLINRKEFFNIIAHALLSRRHDKEFLKTSK